MIKALTISQPFASLIASGEKWIENRTWSTDYRGSLAIHAGRGTQDLTRKELAAYPYGCIVAVSQLVACVHLEEIRRQLYEKRIANTRITVKQVLTHRHCEGPWLWIFRDIRRLKDPFPCNGAQGLWDWPDFDQCVLESNPGKMPEPKGVLSDAKTD